MSPPSPDQVLSSPDIALGRLTAHRDAAILLATPADAATLLAAPLHLVDPAAGEATNPTLTLVLTPTLTLTLILSLTRRGQLLRAPT